MILRQLVMVLGMHLLLVREVPQQLILVLLEVEEMTASLMLHFPMLIMCILQFDVLRLSYKRKQIRNKLILSVRLKTSSAIPRLEQVSLAQLKVMEKNQSPIG